jgi:hypothetical protein
MSHVPFNFCRKNNTCGLINEIIHSGEINVNMLYLEISRKKARQEKRTMVAKAFDL